MVDPPAKPEDPQPVNLIALGKEWGVDLGNNLIVDPVGQMYGTGPLTPIAKRAPGGHPISRDLRAIIAFPMARSATPIEGGASGRVAQKVIETSPQSWAEADVKDLFATRRPQQNVDKGDLPGPIAVVSAVSAPAPDAPDPASPDLPKTETRVVVAGDADFLSNNVMNPQLGNSDLGLNIANYLAQQENLIAIRAKDPENRTLAMSTTQKSTLTWLTLLIIPLLLVGAGVRAWWKRR